MWQGIFRLWQRVCQKRNKGNVPVTVRQEGLRRSRNDLRALSVKKIAMRRKCCILQKGRFLGALLPPVRGVLSSLLLRQYKLQRSWFWSTNSTENIKDCCSENRSNSAAIRHSPQSIHSRRSKSERIRCDIAQTPKHSQGGVRGTWGRAQFRYVCFSSTTRSTRTSTATKAWTSEPVLIWIKSTRHRDCPVVLVSCAIYNDTADGQSVGWRNYRLVKTRTRYKNLGEFVFLDARPIRTELVTYFKSIWWIWQVCSHSTMGWDTCSLA